MSDEHESAGSTPGEDAHVEKSDPAVAGPEPELPGGPGWGQTPDGGGNWGHSAVAGYVQVPDWGHAEVRESPKEPDRAAENPEQDGREEE